jgi:DNA-binding NarL/FixJ family response regulator
MPVCDGVVATREIHQKFPWIEILILTTFTEGTVKNYITRILSQLNMRDRVGAALWAQRHLLD